MTTANIKRLSEILKVERLPFEWWDVLLHNRDRSLFLVLADWLEIEQDDTLHAEAWREIARHSWEPQRSGHNAYFFREGMLPNSWPMQYYGPEYPGFNEATIPDWLFWVTLAIERPINTIRVYKHPQYVCISRSVGRADALTHLAHGMALHLAGLTITNED